MAEKVPLEPVFLPRFLEKMKKQRGEGLTASGEELLLEQGLKIRQMPHTKKLVYEPGSQDVMVYTRKTPLNLDQEFK